MDISAACVAIHIRTDANNLVTTTSTTRLPDNNETKHIMQMVHNEACSGQIEDQAHVASAACLLACLTQSYSKPEALMRGISGVSAT